MVEGIDTTRQEGRTVGIDALSEPGPSPASAAAASSTVPRGSNTLSSVALLVFADLTAVTATAALAILVRRDLLPSFPGFDTFTPVRNYLSLWPALVLLVLGRAAVGLYPGHGLHPAEDLRRQTWVTLGLVAAVLAGGALFGFSTDYSRVVLVSTALLLAFALPATRSATRLLLSRSGHFGIPVWVLGDSTKARHLAGLLSQEPTFGLRPIGVGTAIPADEVRCRHCLVVPDGFAGQPIAQVLDHANERFQRVWLVPDLLDVASVWVAPRDIQGHLALELRNNLLERSNQLTKRCLDVGLCLIALPVASLVGVVIAAVIRATSGPHVIIRQERMAAGGRPFAMLKFRTMHTDANERLSDLLAAEPSAREEWDHKRKLMNDPRVTRFGRILRKTSLDELPQLVNVLLGDMSLVGPRPVMPDEVERYGASAQLLHKVKPGMTGMTQISGRSSLAYADRVRLDIYYVRNWSIWLDLVVLGRTLRSVIRGTGAY